MAKRTGKHNTIGNCQHAEKYMYYNTPHFKTKSKNMHNHYNTLQGNKNIDTKQAFLGKSSKLKHIKLGEHC